MMPRLKTDPKFPQAVAHHLTQRGLQYKEEPFKLRGGGESHWYFDAKKALSPGWLTLAVGSLAIRKAKEAGIDYGHICAMGIGGFAVMFGMVISAEQDFHESLYWTMAYQGKSDDPNNGLSGAEVNGKKVMAADDVLSTGDSLMTTIDMIREQGGEVHQAIVLVTRSTGLAEQRLEVEKGVRVTSLFSFSEASGIIVPNQP